MPIPGPATRLRGPGGRFAEGNFGFQWTGLQVIANNINKRGNTLNATRRAAMERLAGEMEDWARANAVWNDRTGNARASLSGQVVHDEENAISTAYIGHGVPYGIWLEVWDGGRLAIIEPTIQHFGQRMFSTVERMMTTGQALEMMGFEQ